MKARNRNKARKAERQAEAKVRQDRHDGLTLAEKIAAADVNGDHKLTRELIRLGGTSEI